MLQQLAGELSLENFFFCYMAEPAWNAVGIIATNAVENSLGPDILRNMRENDLEEKKELTCSKESFTSVPISETSVWWLEWLEWMHSVYP